jgi:hypothetical protein
MKLGKMSEAYEISIVERTVLLATFDVLGPVTGSCAFIVKESADAELLSGSPIPAGPISCAAGFMPEDAVQPVAVLRGYGGVGLALTIAVVRPPRVVAALGDAAVFTREHQAIRAVKQLRTSVYAFPITVAILDVSDNA